jgi:hypothetical protein
MANPLQEFLDGLVRLLGNLGGGRNRPSPRRTVEQPVSPPPQSVSQHPPQYEIAYFEEPTIEREGDNVFYVSGTNRTLGRWQAGTGEEIVERQDIEDLLNTIPKNKPWYVLIIWGSTEGIYPGKISQDTYLSLKVEGRTMFDAFEDNPLGDVVDWINTMEDFMAGPRWLDVYSVSIVDRF